MENKILLVSVSTAELRQMIGESLKDLLPKIIKELITNQTSESDQLIPIQEIFNKKICSKPTFYNHLRKGNFKLLKFGNKSFVNRNEFFASFKETQF